MQARSPCPPTLRGAIELGGTILSTSAAKTSAWLGHLKTSPVVQLQRSTPRRATCPFTAKNIQSTMDRPHRQHASTSSISGVLGKVWLLLTCSYGRKRRGSQHRSQGVWCQDRRPTRSDTARLTDLAATTAAGAIIAPPPCLLLEEVVAIELLSKIRLARQNEILPRKQRLLDTYAWNDDNCWDGSRWRHKCGSGGEPIWSGSNVDSDWATGTWTPL